MSLVKEGRNGKAEIDAMMKGSARRPHRNWRGRPWSRSWTSKPAKPAIRKGKCSRVAPSGVQRHAICDGRRVARDGASVWHRAQIKCYASVSSSWTDDVSHDEMMNRLQRRVEAHFKPWASVESGT